MTRKTPSRTKRELEKLRRGRDDADDGPREVAVELAGVPARSPEDDEDRDLERGDFPRFVAYTADLDSGTVETPDRPDPDDLPECATPDCPNPSMPFEGESVCEKCADMPRRDWRPVVRENEEGGGE
jgi:hypothetical protein